MCANLSKRLVFLPPFQGEGRGGDGVDCIISVYYNDQSHPHPNLPLEGEGTKSSNLALIGVEGEVLRESANWTLFNSLSEDGPRSDIHVFHRTRSFYDLDCVLDLSLDLVAAFVVHQFRE